MPQLTSTVLVDRHTPTPVNHTFVPVDRIDGGIGVLERKGTSYLGNELLTVSYRATPAGRLKSVAKLAVPVVADETINGITYPRRLRVGYAEVRFDFDQQSLTQERADLVGMTMSLLDPAKIYSLMVVDAEAVRS